MTVAVAPLFASFYKQPALTLLICALAIGFVFGSAGVIHEALLRRRMAFKQITFNGVLASLAGIIGACIMAWQGAGWWALVAQSIIQMAIGSALNWLSCNWRPSLCFRWMETSHLFRFGVHLSGFNIINYFSRNADKLLIGWYWGASVLGPYSKAYDMLLGQISQLTMPLHSLMQPLLARLRDEPARYRNAYLQVMIPANLCMTPLAAIMMVMPDALVTTLLGAGWEQAEAVVRWLGIAVFYQVAGSSIGFVLMSQLRSSELAWLGVVGGLLTTLSFCVALPWGIEAIAAVYVLNGLLICLPILFWQTGRKGSLSAGDLWSTLRLPLWALIWMVLGLLMLRPCISDFSAPVRLSFALLCAVALLLASVVVIPNGRGVFKGIIARLSEMRTGR
jgi:PST family polysaccharide transporter